MTNGLHMVFVGLAALKLTLELHHRAEYGKRYVLKSLRSGLQCTRC